MWVIGECGIVVDDLRHTLMPNLPIWPRVVLIWRGQLVVGEVGRVRFLLFVACALVV